MNKAVIFNVGGAMSAYVELPNGKFVVDLGKSSDFNPVLDFLLPLANKKFSKSQYINGLGRYGITQLYLSHLDNDHIATINEFDEHFHPSYMTAPNDHPQQNIIFRIIRSLFDTENKNVEKVLKMMTTEEGRIPGHGRDSTTDAENPLVVHPLLEDSVDLYYIPPKICHENETLKTNCSNNMSLVLLCKLNGHSVMFTGDIMDEGMSYLLENNSKLKSDLEQNGLDYLITPHHGLTTSFPDSLFQTIKGSKVGLNIISEKIAHKEEKENRSDVDTRYSSPDFSRGHKIINGLKDFQHSIMTSISLGTHILIDFNPELPVVKRCTIEELLEEF